ncbi:hypothetical protein ATERTT37_002535 [Aspergillus terreus]
MSCFYRWYTPSEVCDILQKFDGVVFVGDESLADIYAGFNIILRQDLQTGSLRDWDMSPPQLEKCNCDAQFTKVSHDFITVTNSPAPKGTQEKFRQLLSQTETPQKPVAVIQSLSLSTSYSLTTAKNSMDEWLGLAQSSSRITPFLWVGPTAPGHQKPSGDNVHASSWQYTLDVAAAAQADSWDGMHYGEKVALMQAMMIINWLSAL